MRRLVLLAALLAGCGGGGGGGGDGGAGGDGGSGVDAEIGPLAPYHLIGRFDTSNADAPRFAWPGSAIWTRFSGPGVTVRLDDGGQNQFEVVIDGAAAPVLVTSAGEHDYALGGSLADGPHDLVVARRTESFFGITTFLGFSGATLIDTPAPTRWIEMIGDSITCGYGVLGDSATCNFSADTEAESYAWGGLAADQLGAAHAAIAYSGKGVYRNYGGDTSDLMGALFERTFADDSGSSWDFAGYTADVVVIDLGTNDFSTGDPGQPFADAYAALVAQVRGHYPDAWIIAAMSPMISDSWPVGAMQRTLLRGYLEDVVAAAGPAVSYLEIAEQDEADGIGCDYHPNQVTHQKMAGALVTEIRARLGW